MDKQLAKKAAKWWADQLRKQGGAKLDNGDNSETGAFTFIMGKMLQKSHPTDKIDKFEGCLLNKIMGMDTRWATISVDYGPDRLLSDAAEEAGLDLTMTDLPWKTVMWVESNRVLVAEGYRAEPIEI